VAGQRLAGGAEEIAAHPQEDVVNRLATTGASLLRLLFAALLTATAATTPSAAQAAGCPGAGLLATPKTMRSYVRATRCLLNAQRAADGLPALRPSRRLAGAARSHSGDMVRRHYFDHVSPTGSTLGSRIRDAGYARGARSWSGGETIAYATGAAGTPAGIVALWMSSPPHRAEILDPGFRHVGIGLAVRTPTGQRGATVTADFGGRG
jgi:uncharacterized protein YkwD